MQLGTARARRFARTAASKAARSSASDWTIPACMQISMPTLDALPADVPACQAISFVGILWNTDLSSTVKCHETFRSRASAFFWYLACAAALAPGPELSVLWIVKKVGSILVPGRLELPSGIKSCTRFNFAWASSSCISEPFRVVRRLCQETPRTHRGPFGSARG